MLQYKFYENYILEINRGDELAFIDLSDFTTIKRSDYLDDEDFETTVKDLFGYYGILEKLEL
jgi:hypothetical protein